jgi:glycosyltransferase involved in cell wall biosynthesis
VSKEIINKEKLWIVSEVFFPEEVATSYILTEIAISLSNDFDVNIICGPESYEKKLKDVDYSRLNGIKIHRINKFNFNKNKLITRILRLLLLSTSMFFIGLSKIKKSQKVLLVTNPATIIPLYAILNKILKFDLYYLIHDVFPENLIPIKIFKGNNLIYKLIKLIYDASYRQATKIIVLGRDMKQLMLKKTNFKEENIIIIENWADLENVYPIPMKENIKYPQEFYNKILIQYAGNFGRLQNLDVFLNLFAKVNNPKIHFVLIGRGAMERKLRNVVIEKCLTNVSIETPFRRIEQNEFINSCNLGLVTLTDELYGLGVPSKTYNILAAQKAVLFIGRKDTEIALMINESNCGYTFEFNQEVEIIDFLNNLDSDKVQEIELLAKNARSLALNKYSKDIIINKYRNLFLN